MYVFSGRLRSAMFPALANTLLIVGPRRRIMNGRHAAAEDYVRSIRQFGRRAAASAAAGYYIYLSYPPAIVPSIWKPFPRYTKNDHPPPTPVRNHPVTANKKNNKMQINEIIKSTKFILYQSGRKTLLLRPLNLDVKSCFHPRNTICYYS